MRACALTGLAVCRQVLKLLEDPDFKPGIRPDRFYEDEDQWVFKECVGQGR